MSSERQLQNERREVIKQDAQLRSQVPAGATLHQRAQVEIGQEYGGRFSPLRTQQQIVGTAPIAYPKLPSNSPWAKSIDEVCGGIEPPLGFDIDEMEPVGTQAEIERGLREPSQPSPKDQNQDDQYVAGSGPQSSKEHSVERRSPRLALDAQARASGFSSSSAGAGSLSTKFRRRI